MLQGRRSILMMTTNNRNPESGSSLETSARLGGNIHGMYVCVYIYIYIYTYIRTIICLEPSERFRQEPAQQLKTILKVITASSNNNNYYYYYYYYYYNNSEGNNYY